MLIDVSLVVWDLKLWGDYDSLVVVDDSAIAVSVPEVLVPPSSVLVDGIILVSWNVAVGIESVVQCFVHLALSDALVEVDWVCEAWGFTLSDFTGVVLFPNKAGAVLLIELVAISIEDVEVVAGLLTVDVSDVEGLLGTAEVDGVED